MTHMLAWISGALVFPQCNVAWLVEMMGEAEMSRRAIYLCQTWLNAGSYWLRRIAKAAPRSLRPC